MQYIVACLETETNKQAAGAELNSQRMDTIEFPTK